MSEKRVQQGHEGQRKELLERREKGQGSAGSGRGVSESAGDGSKGVKSQERREWVKGQ